MTNPICRVRRHGMSVEMSDKATTPAAAAAEPTEDGVSNINSEELVIGDVIILHSGKQQHSRQITCWAVGRVRVGVVALFD